jgi:streptogramin lyase/DNA-directed RNA polymerase subunit RPC12/RpoP
MPTTFKCPMCAAPLDTSDASGATVRCPYCENTVILPEELRGGAGGRANNNAGQSAGATFAPMIDQALKMAEVARLLRAGNKIAAIKLYREIFGVGLKDAKDAVERIERGEPITFTQTTAESVGNAMRSSPGAAAPLMQEHAINQKKGRGGRCLIVGLVLVVAIAGAFLLFGGGALYFVSRTAQTGARTSPLNKPSANSFANVALEFGSEGIGASQFKDTRSVAVDGEGRIYTAEYIGGRVQVFDSQGKFLTQWMVDRKRPLVSMAADRKGNVYIVQGGSITRYEGQTGQSLGEVESRGPGFNQNYSSVFAALDGSLYAVAASYQIVHILADGRIKSIFNAREKSGEDLHLDGLAVSGSGHIYAVDRSEESVFKFAPDGKYINRFGGEGDAAGQLKSPDGISVDGQGRVYVCDIGRAIQVFDANGRYLDSFAPNEVIFEIAINDQNEIFASQRNRHKIVKYVLKKP